MNTLYFQSRLEFEMQKSKCFDAEAKELMHKSYILNMAGKLTQKSLIGRLDLESDVDSPDTSEIDKKKILDKKR